MSPFFRGEETEAEELVRAKLEPQPALGFGALSLRCTAPILPLPQPPPPEQEPWRFWWRLTRVGLPRGPTWPPPVLYDWT